MHIPMLGHRVLRHGTSVLTPCCAVRASGKSVSITRRRIKNDRLAAAGWIWAFGAATHCQSAGEHYRRRRELGDRHAAAQRNLFNRLLGQLYYCLQVGQTFNESKAFSPPLGSAA